MLSSTCCIDNPTVEKTTTTTDTEMFVKETDFIVGSCSSSFDSLPSTSAPLDHSVNERPLSTTTTTLPHDNVAFVECIRLLTRQLRQSPKIDRNLHCADDEEKDHSTKSTSTDDDWNEQFVVASKGIPELLALQNTIIQLQHAFHLIQQEANMALYDTNEAMQSSQHWKREYHVAKQSVIALEQDNRILKQQTESLMADKRKLKAACKKLLMQQHAVQAQQVESYVVSALVAHEQFLHGTATTTSSTGKNRSRTTTLDTTGTTAGDDFTALDDPFTNSPHATIESSDGSSHSPKANTAAVDGNIATTNDALSTPPTIVTMKEHNHQNQLSQQHRGMNGFGHACHAFGRTFKFIDNHVHKKDQRTSVATENPTECSTTTIPDCLTPVEVTTAATYSPMVHDRPYSPIRLDAITPTRSEDSNDSIAAHHRRRNMPSSPLIDVNALLNGPMDDSNVNDHNMARKMLQHQPMSDQLLLSLPILPHSYGSNYNNIGNNIAGSLKSVSPISIPEAEEENETMYSHEPTSALRIHCQRYSCDPSLLRSLSIPTISIHAQPPPSTPPDIMKARHC